MKKVKIFGGLGNQMFQYAFGLHLASATNEQLLYDLSWFTEHSNQEYQLEKVFGVNLPESTTASSKLVEKLASKLPFLVSNYSIERTHFRYDSFQCASSAKYFIGYWQSPLYFQGLEEKLRERFRFEPHIDKRNIEIEHEIKSRRQSEEFVALHVRRGDYVSHPDLNGLCDKAYYESCLRLIEEKTEEVGISLTFLVFSDDIPWVRKNLDLKSVRVRYVDWNIKEPFRDMQIMSSCQHFICANSTFSWWAAWLSTYERKIVCMPRQWSRSRSVEDLYSFDFGSVYRV